MTEVTRESTAEDETRGTRVLDRRLQVRKAKPAPVQILEAETPAVNWRDVAEGTRWPISCPYNEPYYDSPPIFVPIWSGFDVDNAHGARMRISIRENTLSTQNALINVGSWANSTLYWGRVAYMVIDPSLSVFKTDTQDIPAGGFHGNVSFPTAFQSQQPQVFITFDALDLSVGWRLDINVSSVTEYGFYLDVAAWGSPILHGGRIRYLAWAGDNAQIDVHTVDSVENQKGTTGSITYHKHFAQPPQIFIGMTKIDIAGAHDGRINLVTSNVTTNGFDYTIGTWGDTILYEIRVMFLVIGDLSDPDSDPETDPETDPEIDQAGSGSELSEERAASEFNDDLPI